MKKFLSVLFAAVIAVTLVLPVSAEVHINPYEDGQRPRPSRIFDGNYMPMLEKEGSNDIYVVKNMIRNPYYKIHYNELLENCVKIYEESEDGFEEDYIAKYVDYTGDEAERYVTLILKTPEEAISESENSIRNYNLSVLGKYFPDEQILYIADRVFAAVVMLLPEDTQTVKSITEAEFIGDAFFDSYGAVTADVSTRPVGDADNKYIEIDGVLTKKVTASDARLILRYTAGLYKNDSKGFLFVSDVDFDNEITAADARLALRTAAGLESVYKLSYGSSAYWYDTAFDDVLYYDESADV